MNEVRLRDGTSVPALGLGTVRIGDDARKRDSDVAAVRTALRLGYRLFDTAEMYGDGGAEEVIGVALRGAIDAGEIARDDAFIVSKVLPQNASRTGVIAACERSLKRLGVDAIDLYLLHWRGRFALRDTVAAFEALCVDGRIRFWGVSNFDVDDLQELEAIDAGRNCAANQVYYSASRRGVEFDLLPHCRARRIPLIAYCPLDEGALIKHTGLAAIGKPRAATSAQIALSWLLRQPDVIVIPKSGKEAHLRENLAAAQMRLAADDLAAVDRLFPPPRGKTSLAMV